MKIMKYIYMFLISALIFVGCDLIDPSDVENPSITAEKLFKDASGGGGPLVTGLKFAFSDAVNRTAIFSECASDNYDNTNTFLSTQFDDPRSIFPGEQYMGDRREIYGKLQILQALCNFGLNTILPADQESTDAQKARTLFYRGMAVLILSENFLAFPIVEEGPMVRAEDAILEAIKDFNDSYALDNSGINGIDCKYALARAYRVAGNKSASVAAANEAIGLDNTYTCLAEYDFDNLNNRPWVFTVLRTQNDMQPLPRLDFLDPKYLHEETSIAVLKAEEMYLILAEAAIVDGDLNSAKESMKNAITTSLNRATELHEDSDDRNNRPSDPNMTVKFSTNSTIVKDSLILARNGAEVYSHYISNTHLRDADIDALSSEADHWYTLYLLRQEIFFSEGRRMSDIGIRLPVMAREIDTNPLVNAGDYGTVVHVPDFIPQGDGMDQFTVEGNVVTVTYDVNRLIVDNIEEISPFK